VMYTAIRRGYTQYRPGLKEKSVFEHLMMVEEEERAVWPETTTKTKIKGKRVGAERARVHERDCGGAADGKEGFLGCNEKKPSGEGSINIWWYQKRSGGGKKGNHGNENSTKVEGQLVPTREGERRKSTTRAVIGTLDVANLTMRGKAKWGSKRSRSGLIGEGRRGRKNVEQWT